MKNTYKITASGKMTIGQTRRMTVSLQDENGTLLSREEWCDWGNGVGWDLENIVEGGNETDITHIFAIDDRASISSACEMHETLESAWRKGVALVRDGSEVF